ncbi:MAG: tetratricopeptide repeat protein [Ferruginibacter sp.]
MKLLSFCLFFILSCTQVVAQDYASLIAEADRLESIPQEKAAFSKFKEALKLQPTSLYALTKCSELCCRVGGRETSTKVRDNYYATAQVYAKTALRLYPNSDEANVVMAFSIAKSLLLKSGKEKITAVKELKSYGEKAVAENSRNFKAWHVLGKWHYEVSGLNPIERAGAKIMYGGLPPASLKNSIMYYEKARSLAPNFTLNYLELAKAYHRNEETQKAITLLKQLLVIKTQTEDDPRIKKEAEGLIAKWN